MGPKRKGPRHRSNRGNVRHQRDSVSESLEGGSASRSLFFDAIQHSVASQPRDDTLSFSPGMKGSTSKGRYTDAAWDTVRRYLSPRAEQSLTFSHMERDTESYQAQNSSISTDLSFLRDDISLPGSQISDVAQSSVLPLSREQSVTSFSRSGYGTVGSQADNQLLDETNRDEAWSVMSPGGENDPYSWPPGMMRTPSIGAGGPSFLRDDISSSESQVSDVAQSSVTALSREQSITSFSRSGYNIGGSQADNQLMGETNRDEAWSVTSPGRENDPYSWPPGMMRTPSIGAGGPSFLRDDIAFFGLSSEVAARPVSPFPQRELDMESLPSDQNQYNEMDWSRDPNSATPRPTSEMPQVQYPEGEPSHRDRLLMSPVLGAETPRQNQPDQPYVHDQDVPLDSPADRRSGSPILQYKRFKPVWQFRDPDGLVYATTNPQRLCKRFGNQWSRCRELTDDERVPDNQVYFHDYDPFHALQYGEQIYLTDSLQAFAKEDDITRLTNSKKLDLSSLTKTWHYGIVYKGWSRPDLDSLSFPEGIRLAVPKDKISPNRFTDATGRHYVLFKPVRQFRRSDGLICATTSPVRLAGQLKLSKGAFTDKSKWNELKGNQRVADDEVGFHDRDPLYALQDYNRIIHLTDNLTAFARLWKGVDDSSLTMVWNYGESWHNGWGRPDLDALSLPQGFTLAIPKSQEVSNRFSMRGRRNEVGNSPSLDFQRPDTNVYPAVYQEYQYQRQETSSAVAADQTFSLQQREIDAESRSGQNQYNGMNIESNFDDNAPPFVPETWHSPRVEVRPSHWDDVPMSPVFDAETPAQDQPDQPFVRDQGMLSDSPEHRQVDNPDTYNIVHKFFKKNPTTAYALQYDRTIYLTDDIRHFSLDDDVKRCTGNTKLDQSSLAKVWNRGIPYKNGKWKRPAPESFDLPEGIQLAIPRDQAAPEQFTDINGVQYVLFKPTRQFQGPDGRVYATTNCRRLEDRLKLPFRIQRNQALAYGWKELKGQRVANEQVYLHDRGPLYALQHRGVIYLTDNIVAFAQNLEGVDDSTLTRVWNYAGPPYMEWSRPDLDSLTLLDGFCLAIPKDRTEPCQFSMNGRLYEIFNYQFRQFRGPDGRVYATIDVARLERRLGLNRLELFSFRWKELKDGERVESNQVYFYDLDHPLYAFQYRGTVYLTDNITAFNGRRGFPQSKLLMVWTGGGVYEGWSRPTDLQALIREGVSLAGQQHMPVNNTSGVFNVEPDLATTYVPDVPR